MRLLDAEALIYDNVAELVEFPDEALVPRYAILSHTWEEEEVLFQDIPLGPQHEIRPSFASLRAISRGQSLIKHGLNDYNYNSGEDIESDADLSDEDSSNIVDTRSHSPSPSPSLSPSDYEKLDVMLPRHSGTKADEPWSHSFRNSINGIHNGVLTPHVKTGWIKVLNTCLQTLRHGLSYVWIDTCCIDKSSSAELSEAINSMFRWYETATICFAWLSDCDLDLKSPHTADATSLRALPSETGTTTDIRSHLEACRWFTRGWTLQELIAPTKLHFFDCRWRFISSRNRILPALESITGIHGEVLSKRKQFGSASDTFRLSKFSVAQRMFWASKRKTTRKEDEAYCLLGVFGINMPLLYGEGRRAFVRLQEEILRTSTDQTIFAWELLPEEEHELHSYSRDILAQSPSNFWWHAHDITAHFPSESHELRMTSEGLEIGLCMDDFRLKYGYQQIIGQLKCSISDSRGTCGIGIRLRIHSHLSKPGRRFVAEVSPEEASKYESKDPTARRLMILPLPERGTSSRTDDVLICHPRNSVQPTGPPSVTILLAFLHNPAETKDEAWIVRAAYPRSQWHTANATMTLPLRTTAYGAVAITHRGEGFILVFGGVAPAPNDFTEYSSNDQSLCQHWILQGPPARKFDRGSYVVDHYLKRLCERASELFAKDYFECCTHRRDCHKWLRLKTVGSIRPRLMRMTRFFQILHLDTSVREITDSGPLADRDYFRLEELSELDNIFPHQVRTEYSYTAQLSSRLKKRRISSS